MLKTQKIFHRGGDGDGNFVPFIISCLMNTISILCAFSQKCFLPFATLSILMTDSVTFVLHLSIEIIVALRVLNAAFQMDQSFVSDDFLPKS